MSDLLKEAIADAKAVRETALQNAKMALEEAFTPQLKSMLTAKLKEDEVDETEPVVSEEDEEEVEADDEVEAEEPVEEGSYDEDEEMGGDEEEVAVDDEEEIPAEEAEIEIDDEEGGEEEEDDLDLEAVIRELESELSEGEEDEEAEEDEVEEAVEESEEPEEVEEATEESAEEPVEEGEEEYEVDESVFIDSDEQLENVQAELKEYKEAVHYLKDKLHEVNILNAKLLFTNKLFKEFALDNGQKLKVVETFDRAQTTREIKLVYSTLAEQFSDNGSIVTKKSISESASSAVASTKPSKEATKVISEEVQVADRFRKLAGLIK